MVRRVAEGAVSGAAKDRAGMAQAAAARVVASRMFMMWNALAGEAVCLATLCAFQRSRYRTFGVGLKS
jgi:hypothetical protein